MSPAWLKNGREHGPYFWAMRNPTVWAALLAPALLAAQPLQHKSGFSHADTLRGSNGPFRAWWDAEHYDVSVRPDFATRSIQGRTTMTLRSSASGQRLQIDLQQPLEVDSIKMESAATRPTAGTGSSGHLSFQREGNVVWVDLPFTIEAGATFRVQVYYHGRPREARNPPWDGGWIWSRTPDGTPWMSVACQGLGASVWYPCKDSQADEPDSAALHITIPDSLVAVGNGRLRGTSRNSDGTTTWHWKVESPINTYNLVPYIGPYVHLGDSFQGTDGRLDLDYWVLRGKEAKAREQFKQVPPMLACFEDWFGPYPFYADGFKLVEAPHLGMEHQSAIAYGNGYRNGYAGSDLSGTGRGLDWDYIIVHESAHEWFGNNITSADIADMWVHEAFADYAETILVQCLHGPAAGNEYVAGLRRNIRNDIPIIGPYGVNQEGSGDMYYKGANMLHTIRHILDNDSLFKAMLRGMNERFHHAVVTGAEVESFISSFTGQNFSLLFDQYLRTTQVPVLQWGIQGGKLMVRWSNAVEGLAMPVSITVNGEERRVPITDRWTSPAYGLREKTTELTVDINWYVEVERLRGRALKRALRSAPH